MMRIDDKQKFEYLLNRGILPSSTNSEGFNSLHFAVKLNKLNYLSYMLEGDYNAFEAEGDSSQLHITLPIKTTEKN